MKNLLKKLTGLFIIATLVLSLSMVSVFADEHEDDENDDFKSGKTLKISDEAAAIAREKFEAARQRAKEAVEKAEQAKAKVEKQKDEVDKVKDEVEKAKEKIKEAKERIKEAKENYQELKAKAKLAHDELKKNRQSLKKCENLTTEECKKVRGKSLEHTSQALESSAKKLLVLLEKTKEKISESKKLGETEKQELLAPMAEKVAKVEAFLTRVPELTTKEDLKEARKELNDLRGHFEESKKIMRKGVFKVASSKIGGVLEKYEKLQKKLQRILEQKIDADQQLKTLIDDFNLKVEKARQLSDEAKILFEEKKVNEAIDKVNQAHKQLKDAHIVLKEIFFKIKSKQDTVQKTESAGGEEDDD